MLLCQFVYKCTQIIAICFTKGYLSEFTPFSLRICTAQLFFVGLAHPTEGLFISYAQFFVIHIIN